MQYFNERKEVFAKLNSPTLSLKIDLKKRVNLILSFPYKIPSSAKEK